MSIQIPLRSVRLPALQRQCLFLRQQHLNRPFAASASRTFASTPSRAHKKNTPRLQDSAQTKAAAAQAAGPSPKVNFEKAQQDTTELAEDIGLLQNTIVRAPFRDLPSPTSWQFWRYFWTLIKAKGTGLYARAYYRRCMYPKGLSSWLPVDIGNNTQLKDKARKLYEQVYSNFAAGNIAPIRQICLPPLAQKFQNRIVARGSLTMEWKIIKWKSARVVSHRASPLGEDHPDTAYRQAIIRLESKQILSFKGLDTPGATKGPKKIPRSLTWVPDEARREQEHQVQKTEPVLKPELADQGQPKTVVEYFVLQKRVIRGREEDWKVWGFAEETTPAKIESDEEYWRKTLNMQAGGA